MEPIRAGIDVVVLKLLGRWMAIRTVIDPVESGDIVDLDVQTSRPDCRRCALRRADDRRTCERAANDGNGNPLDVRSQ
jgi:hypothetical protein